MSKRHKVVVAYLKAREDFDKIAKPIIAEMEIFSLSMDNDGAWAGVLEAFLKTLRPPDIDELVELGLSNGDIEDLTKAMRRFRKIVLHTASQHLNPFEVLFSEKTP